MYKMFFSDRFTESLMALLYKYDIAPVRLKDEDMKKYLRYFIENGSYIDEIFDGQYDNMSNLAIWKTNFWMAVCQMKRSLLLEKHHIYVQFICFYLL